jgi:hypothetical protein
VDARDWNLFLGAQAAREDFSGAAQSERRFFIRDENFKKCMMDWGGEFRSCMSSVTSDAGEACK